MRYLSENQISVMTGLDRRTLKKRLEGLETKPGPKNAKLFDMHEAYLKLSGQEPGSTNKQIQDASLRHEVARAEKMELQNSKLKGDLVAINDVLPAFEQQLNAVRARFLSIPTTYATQLAHIGNPIEIQTKLEDAINEAFEEIQLEEFFEDRQPLPLLPEDEAQD